MKCHILPQLLGLVVGESEDVLWAHFGPDSYSETSTNTHICIFTAGVFAGGVMLSKQPVTVLSHQLLVITTGYLSQISLSLTCSRPWPTAPTCPPPSLMVAACLLWSNPRSGRWALRFQCMAVLAELIISRDKNSSFVSNSVRYSSCYTSLAVSLGYFY